MTTTTPLIVHFFAVAWIQFESPLKVNGTISLKMLKFPRPAAPPDRAAPT